MLINFSSFFDDGILLIEKLMFTPKKVSSNLRAHVSHLVGLNPRCFRFRRGCHRTKTVLIGGAAKKCDIHNPLEE